MFTKLLRRLRGTRDENENGAISTVLLILFSSGFLMSLFALVVDTGTIYYQHRISQNSADLSALAYAKLCASALVTTDCMDQGTGQSKIDQILGAQSPYPVAITEVCGSYHATQIRPYLPLCTDHSSMAFNCVEPNLVTYPALSSFVRVYTATETATQSTALYPLFSRFLDPTLTTVNAPACGQYAWGRETQVLVPNYALALAFTPCDINTTTSTIVSQVFDTSTAACTSTDYDGIVRNYNYKGTFRIEYGATTGACYYGNMVDIGDKLCVSNKATGNAGDFYPQTLQQMLNAAYLTNAPKWTLPIASAKSTTQVTSGTNSYYTVNVIGFVEIKLKGYNFQNKSTGLVPTGGWPSRCTTSASTCVYASITKKITTSSKISSDTGTPNYGVNTLSPLP